MLDFCLATSSIPSVRLISVLVISLVYISPGICISVEDLTPENFDTVVDGSKHVFVSFYAPWCGHCKTLAPDWEIVSNSFKQTSDVVIAKVNADKYKALASKYEVSGFPTIKLFAKGSTTVKDTYMGERTAESMVSYLNKETGNDVRIMRPLEATTTLDDDNFQSIALDPTKDVLVRPPATPAASSNTRRYPLIRITSHYRHAASAISARLVLDGLCRGERLSGPHPRPYIYARIPRRPPPLIQSMGRERLRPA
jgi:protein disulfide-isomerase-like protein